MREARLEKYIKDYVYEKTAETVYLHLENSIRISHISKRGSVTLAIMWANMMQHPLNYPQDKFTYTKSRDGGSGEKLRVAADGIKFSLCMSTGELNMQSRYVYDWFTSGKFKALLDNYDQGGFDRIWTFIPSAVSEPYDGCTEVRGDVTPYTRTDTEKYIQLYTRSHAYDENLDRRMEERSEDLIAGLGNMNLDQPMWSGEDLQKEMESLLAGAVVDGLTYLHKLWRSLLNKWLSVSDTAVYICTPQLDKDRLRDIIDICLVNQYRGNLEAMYLNRTTYDGTEISQVKKLALEKYESKHNAYIEYKILRKVMLPLRKVNCSFVAGVTGETAELLVTSASFHGDSFVQENFESVAFYTMDKTVFEAKYLNKLSAPVVASTY